MPERDPRYDVLFEPVRIGPLIARNRFFQVPHCNGMGMSYPNTMIAMRAMKAEGGWAVVCTEETDFHPSNDLTPIVEGRLWDDGDVAVLARMTDAVHQHGSLAGIELTHTGHRDANLYSREVPLSVGNRPVDGDYPVQARAMDRADIRAFRRWHRESVKRAIQADFDLIYVYLRSAASMPGYFLSRTLNQRTDEYGGSLHNRSRLFREMLEDALEIADGRSAVAVRFTVDDEPDEAKDFMQMFAEVPDLWDVNVREWRRDSLPSRFGSEGSQEELVSFVKQMTSKPVVGVGRFTSPDTMVSQIKRGILDFIGAARPSIADPFLPRKIEEGRIDDIRECIGCNVCVSADFMLVPMRCTQNPTAGEEWRKNWHPEKIPPKRSADSVLIVGAGPSGLECARALGERGYAVTLAEALAETGGRVSRESRLPGLSEWVRVRDYRIQQLGRLRNVELYLQSSLRAEDVFEFGADHIVLATGAHWRRDGVGRHHLSPIPGADGATVFTPDDIMDGVDVHGPVVIYDDECYYMGSVVAERLANSGCQVTLVTPASDVASWCTNTLERTFIEERLHDLGVDIVEKHILTQIGKEEIELTHLHRAGAKIIPMQSLVFVTMREPNDGLFREIDTSPKATSAGASQTMTKIGDCLAPSTIAAAVYAGHRYARELDDGELADISFRRERSALAGSE